MSEYQYYEFRAIDRPLSQQQMRMLRSLSTRAEITPTSFVNTYNWGDFRGDPDELMETCFDAYVYVSNNGLRQFSLRLPAKCFGTAISDSGMERFNVRDAGEFVVIDFEGDDQGGDEVEGEFWMDSLIPLRTELLSGDQRCLYLGWLSSVLLATDLDDDELEPPVPPGLQTLSASLEAFADFLNIDPDLLEVAASVSAPQDPPPSRTEVAAWIRALPEAEKDALLIAAAMDEGTQTGAEILRRYELVQQKTAAFEAPTARTAGQLLAAADELTARKLRLSEERTAAERAREERKAAEARARYLDKLAGREDMIWERVEANIRTTKPKQYELAVGLLSDLRDLSVRSQQEFQFQAALTRLCETHARKPAFIERLRSAGF